MNIDLKRVAFSAALTYLSVCDVVKEKWARPCEESGLFLRSSRGGTNRKNNGMIAKIIPSFQGREVEFTYTASPWELVISAAGGQIRMSFNKGGQLRCVGEGVGLKLRLLQGDEFLTLNENCRYSNVALYDCKMLYTRLDGNAEWSDKNGRYFEMSGARWECEIEEFEVVRMAKESLASFSDCVEYSRCAFEDYAARVTEGGPKRYKEAMRQAAYVNYVAQIEDEGLLQGRVMLMSKNWMNCVWTWDCQFNAVETAGYDPKGSWDNFVSPFIRQHKSGMLIDCINDRSYISSFTKPPVHGWALSHLRRIGIVDENKARWIYGRLLKWVNAWYAYMDWDQDGICQYNHGNDSGWDNCSCFSCGAPIEGPDLSAYLVLCWDELAELSDMLGDPATAAKHRQRADQQLQDLIEHSWDGERFHAYQSGTHRETEDADSLLTYLPILLGDRLPSEIFEKMAADLQEEGRFLTPHGLATERVGDRFYQSDGYWRGPIWAPPMMFIIEGLYKGGCKEFARELAERFCANCAKEGFAENFDATTGSGLRDRAYTWTSSVFLILAKRYLSE